MDSFRSFFFLFKRQKRPIAVALALSPLLIVPPKILLCITQFLPFESVVSFSLSCNPIYRIIGIPKEVTAGSSRRNFKVITLLERDLDHHIACYYCEKLHAMENSHHHLYSHRYRTHGDSRPYLPCWRADVLTSGFFLHCDFSFPTFQMAMKQHRNGHNHSKFLKYLSGKTTTNHRYGYMEQCLYKVRIVAGSLLYRERRGFAIPQSQPADVPWDLILLICPHFTLTSLEKVEEHMANGVLRVDNLVQMRGWKSRMLSCSYCTTDVHLEFESFPEKESKAMIVTKWFDLGQGLSPLDPKWTTHGGADGFPTRLNLHCVRGR
ncbi:hypothetical protein B0J14DRAFT_277288 [Halenospora varia]|nr:hypothetical protein B0J14DRAFT_277288 [Halenospora varia]